MIFERINQLCIENHTTPTALCKEITGSSGNLPTWKKDSFKVEAILSIAQKFDVSCDYLLGRSDSKNPIHIDAQMQTGLSEEAIKELSEVKQFPSDVCGVLSEMIVGPIFLKILSNIGYFKQRKMDPQVKIHGGEDYPLERAAFSAVWNAFEDNASILVGKELVDYTVIKNKELFGNMIRLILDPDLEFTSYIDFT